MTSSISVEPYETVEFPDSDTDSWQVVDPCDSDNDDVITTESDVVSSSDDEGEDVDEEDEDVDIDDVIPSESDVISSEDEDEEDDVITSEDEEEEEEDDDVIVSEDEEDDVDEITNHTQELNKGYELDGLINGEGGAPYNVEISDAMKEDAYFEHMQLQQRILDEDVVEEQDEDEDEDEDEYDEDLDDELVPRWLNNKFERQRMRKLGKKVYPKMKKSKRMVNQYNRPGCAGAKHGLGLNNNLVW